MKKYLEPEMSILQFDPADPTNFTGSDGHDEPFNPNSFDNDPFGAPVEFENEYGNKRQ